MGESNGAWSKGVNALGVLAAGLGVGYYFGIYLPGRDQAQRAAVAACVAAADTQYSGDWDLSCEQLKHGKSCKALPILIAKELDDRRHQRAAECYGSAGS